MTLKQFRELTADRPEEAEIRIESYYTNDVSGTSPVFDVIMGNGQIALLPQAAHIEDGDNVLHVEHKKRALNMIS